jgi:hypothetical protein
MLMDGAVVEDAVVDLVGEHQQAVPTALLSLLACLTTTRTSSREHTARLSRDA